jgi:asparagine synthase (glutamine-hydrolysing)
MCGIAGFINLKQTIKDRMSALNKMTESIVHRGPDDSGHWYEHAAGIALGHRRLSILDLSPAGHQPMLSAGGRYVIVFNGEIYNYRDIRKELESQTNANWYGHSDTEVMLAAFDAWGVEHAVNVSSECSLLPCGTDRKDVFTSFETVSARSHSITVGQGTLSCLALS